MIAKNADEGLFWGGAIAKYEENIWISVLECNGLFRINIDSGSIQFVDYFRKERKEYQLHTQIIANKNKLFFIPWSADNIAIYDLEEEEIRYIPAHRSEGIGYFAVDIINGKYLYLVSSIWDHILQIDVDSEKLVDRYEMAGDLKQTSNCLVPPIRTKNSIWKISGLKNDSWKFDIQKKQYIKCEFAFSEGAEFVARCVGNGCVWVIGDNNILYQLSEECECINQYDITAIIYCVMGDVKAESLKCICFNSVLFIIFYDKNCMIQIPLVKNVPDLEKSKYINFDVAFFPDNYEDLIVMSINRMVIHNDAEEKEVVFNLDTNFLADMSTKKGNVLKEIEIYGVNLTRFIDYVCSIREITSVNYNELDISVGKIIYEAVV